MQSYLDKLNAHLMQFKAISSQTQTKNNLLNVLNLKNLTSKEKSSVA